MPTEPSIDLTIDLLRHGETEGGGYLPWPDRF